MRAILSFLLAASAVWAGGCLTPSLPPINAPMNCEEDRDCPEGYFCAPNPERCANADSDLEPPILLAVELRSERANANTPVEVVMVANEPLGSALVWYVRGDEVKYLHGFSEIGFDDGPVAGKTVGYAYAAEGEGGQTSGPAKVFGIARDRFGNRGVLTEFGALIMDNEGPELLADPTLSQKQAAPGTTITLVFSVNEPLKKNPDVSIRLPSGRETFEWRSSHSYPERVEFEYTWTIPAEAEPDNYDIELLLTDKLGNQKAWELPDALTIT